MKPLMTTHAPADTGATDRLGFSLMEMMMVIVIIGILAGISFSRLDWVRYRADSVSRGVMVELAQAQRLAVSLQTNVRVAVVGGTRLTIHEDTDNNGSVNGAERVMSMPLEHGFRFVRNGAAAIPAPDDPTEVTALIFRRDGSASRSGTLYMSSGLVDGDCKYCRAVAVARGTGRVVWYSLAGGTWRREN